MRWLVLVAVLALAVGCGKGDSVKAPLTFQDAQAQLEDAEKKLVRHEEIGAYFHRKYIQGKETEADKRKWPTLADLEEFRKRGREELLAEIEHAKQLKEAAKH